MYKLDITRAAGKFISNLSAKHYRQVVSTIFSLHENPTPHDSQTLRGHREYRRVDMGEYRIIYCIDTDTVYIAIVGKRNDKKVYKHFERFKG